MFIPQYTRKVISSFDDVMHYFQLPQKLIDLANPPERAHTVAVVTVIPVQSTIGVDVANVASFSI